MFHIKHLHKTIHPNKQLYFKTSEIVRVVIFCFTPHSPSGPCGETKKNKLMSRHLRSTCLITEINGQNIFDSFRVTIFTSPSSLKGLMKLLSDEDLDICPLTLSQPSGFSFRLQEGQHISFSDWALHISDDGAAAVIHEIHTDLKPDQGSAQ